MITWAEYVLIREFDRTLADNTAHAQRIINKKNSLLVRADRRITALERDLAFERARNLQSDLAMQLAAERRD